MSKPIIQLNENVKYIHKNSAPVPGGGVKIKNHVVCALWRSS